MDIYNLAYPDIQQEDIDAVVGVLKSLHLSLGPKIPEFEKAIAAYTGTDYAAAVSNGTAALFLCLIAKNITNPTYEVITSSFSFISSANVAIHAGAKPIFAEIDENSLNVTPDTVAEKINKNTKAIIPVDIFGRPIDCKGFRDLADDHNLYYLQDSCEALGSFQDGVHTGRYADAATFAFYPNKQMTTGEGGIIVSNDSDLIQKIKSLRNQGRGSDKSWLLHDKIGYNFRISDMQAALGISQLGRIEQMIKAKQQIVDWYNDILGMHPNIDVPIAPNNERISWFVYTLKINFDNLKLDNRDQLLDLLSEKGIRAGRYFVPIHLQPIYKSLYGYEMGFLPITEKVASQTIALPFHTYLQKEHVEHICDTIISLLD